MEPATTNKGCRRKTCNHYRENHFRPDYTCWHVVSYNNDGTVKNRHSRANDDSSWARGQAWAVYGYTSCYRETNDTTFLNFAVNGRHDYGTRVKTDDAIPYWDYDAPVTERDSATHLPLP